MAEDSRSALTIAGIIIGGLFLLGRARKPKPPPGPPPEPPPVKAGAAVSIRIFDAATGLLVPQGSPAQVIEGKTYIAEFTVTNRSTAGGAGEVAMPVYLQLKIEGYIGGVSLTFTDVPTRAIIASWTARFLANETKSFAAYFTVLEGSAGQTSALAAEVWSPPGVLIPGAVDSEPLDIVAPITYGASVTIGVVEPV